ncbi:MAG TPA: cyclase family protein [Candidatus Kapabacteria bacterium]|nr:cyclase family protein [Candidatus Kapabacteria bacterium]
MKRWIDISVVIKPGMVRWPGDPEIRKEPFLDMAKGDVCNVSSLAFGSHTGTHMDAPKHFIYTGRTLDQMPFDATIGPCRVIEIKDRESVKVHELENQRIKAGERILFKTRNSRISWKMDSFHEDFVFISKEAAAFLARKKIRTVGIDYLSVGGFRKDGVETHHALLGAGIWIIEGLNLAKIKPGRYELNCLPLKILASDGAPARALLR